MTKNDSFLHLNDPLPADIARRKEMGDLAGAIRLIDQRLASHTQSLLTPRLEAERLRLTRLPHDYPYSRAEALAMIQAEWPQCTEEQFDTLVDHGRIDWRMIEENCGVRSGSWSPFVYTPKKPPVSYRSPRITPPGTPCWLGWRLRVPLLPASRCGPPSAPWRR